MNDVIKKRLLEESELLLKSEMVALVGGDSQHDTPQTQLCQTTCSQGCSVSCSSGCSKQRSS